MADPELAAWIHSAFAWVGMSLGAWLWRRSQRQSPGGGALARGNFEVLIGLLAGAALGNKAVFLAERPDLALAIWQGQSLWPGQSIVGGLLGGLLGVELAKKLTGQTRSTGDAMVWPIAAGLAVGRIGCFLAGLLDDTYGLPTARPWGVDFGDGIPRHPTQLYEIAAVLLLAGLLELARTRLGAVPGLRFKLFLSGYLLWRLGVESLKPVPVVWPLGLSGIQWTCALALLAYLPMVVHAFRQSAADTAPARAA